MPVVGPIVLNLLTLLTFYSVRSNLLADVLPRPPPLPPPFRHLSLASVMPPLLPSSLPCFRPCVLPSLLAGSFTTPRWVRSLGAACWLRQRFTSPSHTRSSNSTSWARSNWCGMAASYTTRCATLTVRSSLPTARSNTYPLTVPLAVAACSTLSGAPHPLCRPSGAYYTLLY